MRPEASHPGSPEAQHNVVRRKRRFHAQPEHPGDERGHALRSAALSGANQEERARAPASSRVARYHAHTRSISLNTVAATLEVARAESRCKASVACVSNHPSRRTVRRQPGSGTRQPVSQCVTDCRKPAMRHKRKNIRRCAYRVQALFLLCKTRGKSAFSVQPARSLLITTDHWLPATVN